MNLKKNQEVDVPVAGIYGGKIKKIRGNVASVEAYHMHEGSVLRRFTLDQIQLVIRPKAAPVAADIDQTLKPSIFERWQELNKLQRADWFADRFDSTREVYADFAALESLGGADRAQVHGQTLGRRWALWSAAEFRDERETTAEQWQEMLIAYWREGAE